MKLVFISGPYRADSIYGIVQNIRKAEAVALKYWLGGCAVICPHKNSSLLDGAAPDSVWLEGDLEILGRCDAIVMMRGWQNSEGATAELHYATLQGLEIIYDPD